MPHLSVYREILEAVRKGIVALNLPQLPKGNVVVRRFQPSVENVDPSLPCVIVSPVGAEISSATTGTNERDDIGYPVLLRMLLGLEPSQEETEEEDLHDLILYWRQKVRQKFIHQRLGAVAKVNTLPHVHTCQIEHRDVIIPRVFEMRGIHENHMLLRFVSRETRG